MRFEYPKITGLIIAVIFAYVIFSQESVQALVNSLNGLDYFASFIAGLFYSFGFTSPFSGGYFIALNLKESDILLNAFIGASGAVIADLTIFAIVRFSFMDEFDRLKKTKFFTGISNFLSKYHPSIKKVIIILLAGVFISSPFLPDEVGVILLAGLTHLRKRELAPISFFFNTLGILILLLI